MNPTKSVYFWFLAALLSLHLIVIALVGKRVRHVLSNDMGCRHYTTCLLSTAPWEPSINELVTNNKIKARASPSIVENKARSP